MAGRGRGSLMNELLKETLSLGDTTKQAPSEQQQLGENNEQRVNDTQTQLGIFSLRPPNNPLPSGGRGLMTPGHFVKSSSQTKEARSPIEKTQAFMSAEDYLKRYSPKEEVPRDNIIKLETASEKKQRSNSKESPLSNKPLNLGPSKTVAPQLTKEEKEEADAEWQKYKFQRQIATILTNATVEEVDDIFNDLKVKLDGCSLSQKYPQFNELAIILECLVDKATKSEAFIEISNCFLKRIAGYDIMQFELEFAPLISRKISELVRVSASDKMITAGAQRFCRLLGAVFKSSLDDERFNTVIISCLQECIEQWTYPEGIGSEVEGFNINRAETHVYAAVELFKEMQLQKFDEERSDEMLIKLERILELLKESLLNECLPRKIREVYLDLLLSYTPRWQHPYNANGGKTSPISLSNPEGKSLKDDVTDLKSDVESDIDRSRVKSLYSCSSIPNDRPTSWNIDNLTNDDNSVTVEFDDFDLQSDSVGTADDTRQLQDDVDDVDEAVIVESDEVKIEPGVVKGVPEDNDVEVEEWEYAEGTEIYGHVEEEKGKGAYDDIKAMMRDLKLEDQISRFEDNVIRDSVLTADKQTLQNILREASFPPGVIYEITVYLDKQREKEKSQNTGQNSVHSSHVRGRPFGSPNFQFNDYGKARGGKQNREQFNTEDMPKKKLLGIGRGGSGYDPRSRFANRVPDLERKEQATPDNWRKRQNGLRKVAIEDDSNWRMRKGRVRARENTPGDNQRVAGNVGNDLGRRQEFTVDLQEARQIGKVEPLPRCVSGERGDFHKVTSQGSNFGFGAGPNTCYRCGEKGHRSDECSDMKALFFG